jgi:PHD/YefM family antitoxin component YafN of YafNO toxin-antitoxin module
MERYLTDEEGHRTAVVLPIDEYEALIEAQEELSDIAAHDEAVADLENGRETRTLRRPRGE